MCKQLIKFGILLFTAEYVDTPHRKVVTVTCSRR